LELGLYSCTAPKAGNSVKEGHKEISVIDRPRLRPVEVVLASASDRRVYLLRDASKMTSGAVTVSEDILYVLRFFDGEHTALDIRAEYMRKFGGFLFEEQLDELLQELDSSLLLEGERFDNYMEGLKSEFAGCETRAASHAGAAYPENAAQLSGMIGEFFTHPDGPGALPPGSAGLSGSGGADAARGLILPHIDLRAGGPCTAWGYAELARGQLPELYVILGTGHSNPENNFAMTRKDFVTPFGRAVTDRAFVDSVLDSCNADFTAGELAHKAEHSVEFQVVFLQYLYRKLGVGGDGPSIVPVLCSFGFGDVLSGASQETSSRIDEFVAALRGASKASGLRICFLASVDLAHLGPRYGDERGIAPPEMGVIKDKDLQMLGAVERGSAEEFVSFVHEDRDSRRVCGFSPIYTLLKTLGPTRGRLLNYSYAPVDNAGSVVSFASMVLD
jgi:AmmeMemoRadiSam system protein B